MLRSLFKTLEEIVYVEKYCAVRGFVQTVDPRLKFFSFTILVLVAASVRTITPLILLFVAIVVLSVATRIPLRFFLFRVTFFVPLFTAVMALPLIFITPGTPLAVIGFDWYSLCITSEGVYKAVHFTLKIWVCVASLTLLVLTTRFSSLLHAMEKFKIPKVFVMMTAVTYRFVFLFVDEACRMVLARESRRVGREHLIQVMRSLANIISTLFIRSYERGERVYMAMLARGYTGDVKSLVEMRFQAIDYLFGIVVISLCVLAFFIDFLHIGGL